jgi:hypothetical protein
VLGVDEAAGKLSTFLQVSGAPQQANIRGNTGSLGHGLARLNKRVLASLVPQVAELAIDGGVLASNINFPAEEKDNHP